MYTPLYLQEVRTAELELQRINESRRNEQLRLARANQSSLITRSLTVIGSILIATGERLHREPTRPERLPYRKANAARTA
jgi:hypothetical protein